MLPALLSLAVIAIVLALPLLVRQAARVRKSQAARRAARSGPLEVPLYDPGRERRFSRESGHAEDEARLRGLVLLDLPDFDSRAVEHRIEDGARRA